MKEIIVIAGSTASGKSSIAIELAKRINGYIINGDSRQIYKEIPICTAQPIPHEISSNGIWIVDGIEHYLYGFKALDEEYSIYDYQKDVLDIINKKEATDMTPIIVGGTGLYIDSVIFNYSLDSNSESKYDRNYLNTLPLDTLKQMVGNRINSLNESDRNNPRRLIRLLEKSKIESSKGEPIMHKYFIVNVEKEQLEQNIKNRINTMFEMGIVDENRMVWEKYKERDLKALKTIGFSEMIPYFKNEITIDQAKDLIFIHTKQYSKRQRTWFKRNKDAFRVTGLEEILTILKDTSR